MKYKTFIAFLICHFAISIGGFVGLNAWALAEQDADLPTAPVSQAAAADQPSPSPGGDIGWVEALLHFGLLQPVAHWFLASGALAWWTWFGLAQLALLIGINSLVVSFLASTGLRAWHSRRAARV